MNILGISAFYHDSAACLVQNGKIVAAAQEERFTRIKHDASFPLNAIGFCLEKGGISSKKLNYIAFYEKPFLKFERILETYVAYAPIGIRSFLKSIPMWLKEKFFLKELIYNKLNFSGKIIFPEHHESHAASAFFPSPFDESAILTVDGVGEWTTASFGIGNNNEIKIIAEMKFPHSLGLLYSAFTYHTGFRVNSGEYKLMGLAPYGEAKYKDLILRELIDLKEDGSFKLNMKYFDYCAGLKMTNKKFETLFGGPARKPESKITKREVDIAKSIQEVTEEIMIKIVKHIHKITGQNNLCLAGGVALNCVANGKILKSGPFKNIWIQPAAGDAGGAVGCALFCWYPYLKNERKIIVNKDSQNGCHLGTQYSNKKIEEYLKSIDSVYKYIDDEHLYDKVAKLLMKEKVVGWFQGKMEFGPRALGSRSILGDARSPKIQEIMNLKIKFRESFRPFAPSVLRERVSEYFDLNRESPYMLLVAPVQTTRRRKMTEEEEKLFGIEKLNIVRSEIPAVTHVDYSARVQTVEEKDNPRYYRLIKRFEELTGCPVIVNTSFNVRGEPIVCKPKDAFLCFMRTNMDYLVMENYILKKSEQKLLENDIDWEKEFELD
jgi:carbamoyltransferase